MRSFLLTISFLALFGFFAQSQTFWEENFESYSTGDYIGNQSTVWDTWSGTGAGTAEDLFVVSNQANSGSNSLECVGGGSADVLIPLNNYSEGEYTFELSIYIEPGNGAYYNVQEDTSPGIGWAFECFFSDDGTWEIIMDQVQVASGTYNPASWFRMSHVIDIAGDVIAIYQDGAPMGSFTFDSPLGGINIFPFAPTGQTALYYIDDIYIYKSKEDFDDYLAGAFLGSVSQQWSTWSGSGSQTTEDGVVSNTFSYNGTNSGRMEGTSCDALYPMGNFSAGTWELNFKMLTPNSSGAYFNLQHDEVPGISWAHELFIGGTSGTLDTEVPGAANFSWSDDTWHTITLVYDIDNDVSQLLVDGNSVHIWTFSDESQGFGTGAPIIGALNFFPSSAPNGLNPEFYVDDITFRRTSLITSIGSIDNFIDHLDLFPNPSHDIAFIKNNTNQDLESDIRVFNSTGQRVFTKFEYFQKGEVIEINSTPWKSGAYFIEFIANDSRKIIKFIKD